MRLQTNTSLALYSVLEFASDPERHISAAEIAAKYGVSSHHLAKVLAVLARSGIVASVRGAGGGYRFTGNAKRLTLMDIVQMFEEIAPAHAQRGTNEEGTPVETALGVVLSEIVDLASEYSTDDSGPFVNGVLAAIAAEVRTDGDPHPESATG